MAMISHEESYKGFIKDIEHAFADKDFERMLLLVLTDIAASLDDIITKGTPRPY